MEIEISEYKYEPTDEELKNHCLTKEDYLKFINIDGYYIFTTQGRNRLPVFKSENTTINKNMILYIPFYNKKKETVRLVYDMKLKQIYGREIVFDHNKKLSVISSKLCNEGDSLCLEGYYLYEKETIPKVILENIFNIKENYRFSNDQTICAKLIPSKENVYNGQKLRNDKKILTSLTNEEEIWLLNKGFLIGNIGDVLC